MRNPITHHTLEQGVCMQINVGNFAMWVHLTTFEALDFSLCSHSLLFKFIDYLQDECKLGHGGRLGYLMRSPN